MKNYYYDMVESGELEKLRYLPTIPQFLDFICGQYASLPALCEKSAAFTYEKLVSRVKRRVSFLVCIEAEKRRKYCGSCPE